MLSDLRLKACNTEQKFIAICLTAMVKKGAEEWHCNKISWKKLEGNSTGWHCWMLQYKLKGWCNTMQQLKILLQHYKKLISTSGNDCSNEKLWGMSVAGYVILEILCHNKITKQVAGKIAKCRLKREMKFWDKNKYGKMLF